MGRPGKLEPYHVARMFASLDHISDGRAGRNIVAIGTESTVFNFGRDAHPGHSFCYDCEDEFVEVTKQLRRSGRTMPSDTTRRAAQRNTDS